jgi:NAD(P)-dependent dehydrogenase (short-subunit alcohol dehydrogenase family)
MATYDVADRSAVMTGAGPGIGRAVALLLNANGTAVLVHDLVGEGADAVVVEIIAAVSTAKALVGDVADPEVAIRAVRVAEELAPVRIAVNNAAIATPWPAHW